MTEDEARIKTVQLFGEDSFTEEDDAGGMVRYYVGALPKSRGPYTGFMGFSWEEALSFAAQQASRDIESEYANLTSPSDYRDKLAGEA